MTCRTVQLDDQQHAIVCMRDGHQHRVASSCGRCSAGATRLCDWKLRPGVTCDMPLCDEHTSKPSPGKDLCPRHATAWAARQRQGELAL